MPRTITSVAVAVAAAIGLLATGSTQAFGPSEMMNPSKMMNPKTWMGGGDKDQLRDEDQPLRVTLAAIQCPI